MKNLPVNKEKIRVLVYAPERAGYPSPKAVDTGNNIELVFAEFKSKEKFQTYDGVIMFQGIWAKWKQSSDYSVSENYLTDVQNDELRKRVKQLQQLLKNGGFVCFLMGKMRYNDFDLSKYVISWFPSSYYNAIADNEFVKANYDELKKYIDNYGVAKTTFSHHGDIDFKVLASTENYDGNVGVCFERQIFFLPCHAPDRKEEDVVELFKTLVPSLVSLFKKINQELPDWISNYKFKLEEELISERKELHEKLSSITERLITFEKYKQVIAYSGEPLRTSISFLLSEGFGFSINMDDDLKEDLKIMSSERDPQKNKVLALIEVKGVNGNVDREAVNQVDSHRERGGYKSSMAGILIANTFIKTANSIKAKDKPVNAEQVQHAYRNNVLIIRTIDLIRALNLCLVDKDAISKFKQHLFSDCGWLEVKDDVFILHNK